MLAWFKNKSTKWIGCTSVLVITFLALALFLFVEPPVFLFVVPRAEWADYRTWRQLDVPDDPKLLNPEPYPDELIFAARDLISVFRDHEDVREPMSWLVSLDDSATTQSLLPTAQLPAEYLAFADAFWPEYQRISQLPGFDLNIFEHPLGFLRVAPSLGLETIEIPAFYSSVAISATIHALRQLESENKNGAQETLISYLRSLQFDPWPDFGDYAMQGVAFRKFTFHCATFIEANPDPELAMALLHEMRNLDFDPATPSELKHPDHLSYIGPMRQFKKLGVTVSIATSEDIANIGLPEFVHGKAWLQLEIDRMSASDPAVRAELEVALHDPDLDDSLARAWDTYPFLDKAIRGVAFPVFYTPKADSFRFEATRRLVRVQLDLLMIKLAMIQYQSETSQMTTEWDQLVPKYFPAPLEDPFSKSHAPYLLETIPRSVGFDGDDDKGEIIEDYAPAKKPDGDQILQYSAHCADDWSERIDTSR